LSFSLLHRPAGRYEESFSKDPWKCEPSDLHPAGLFDFSNANSDILSRLDRLPRPCLTSCAQPKPSFASLRSNTPHGHLQPSLRGQEVTSGNIADEPTVTTTHVCHGTLVLALGANAPDLVYHLAARMNTVFAVLRNPCFGTMKDRKRSPLGKWSGRSLVLVCHVLHERFHLTSLSQLDVDASMTCIGCNHSHLGFASIALPDIGDRLRKSNMSNSIRRQQPLLRMVSPVLATSLNATA
jgi:hypothetical protein